jgi:hypothetical protein
MKESNIQQLIRLEASRLGCILWRNNTGMLRNDKGTPVRYGLCEGSSDLIGIYKGRFVAIEVKQPKKKPTCAQINFLLQVRENGGISGCIDSPDKVENLLNERYDLIDRRKK